MAAKNMDSNPIPNSSVKQMVAFSAAKSASFYPISRARIPLQDITNLFFYPATFSFSSIGVTLDTPRLPRPGSHRQRSGCVYNTTISSSLVRRSPLVFSATCFR